MINDIPLKLQYIIGKSCKEDIKTYQDLTYNLIFKSCQLKFQRLSIFIFKVHLIYFPHLLV